MSFYRRTVLPFLLDRGTDTTELNAYRGRLLAGARGRVLEIGFGSGLSAAHYPATVESVVAIDSNDGHDPRAKKRAQKAPVPIELRAADGQALPFADATFNGVVTSLVLCSVSDVGGVLAEVRRVLKPDGRYFFLEHGLSEEPKLQKWQRRMNGVQMALCGGCRLDRPIRSLIEANGFRFENVEDVSLKSVLWFISSATWGQATAK